MSNGTALYYYYPFNLNYNNYATGNPVADLTVDVTNLPISSDATKIYACSLSFPSANTTGCNLPNITFNANGITVAFWAKITYSSTNALSMRLIEFSNTSASTFFSIYFVNNNLCYSVNAGGLSSTFTLNNSNWNHYCLTISSSNVWQIYVNGTSLGINYTAYPELVLLQYCYLGGSRYASTGLKYANMNQFIVLNRQISATELSYLVNNTTAVKFNSNSEIVLNADSYSTIPSSLAYGSSSTFKLNFSSSYLKSTATYTLKQGSTTLNSQVYNGYKRGGHYGRNDLKSLTVDQSGIVWIELGISGIGKWDGDPAIAAQYTINYPSTPPNYTNSRIRYYNGLIYVTGLYGLNNSSGYYGVINTSTYTVLYWQTNTTYHYTDIAFGNDGYGYMPSGVCSNSATTYQYQWMIDKINPQTNEITNVVTGSKTVFESASSISANYGLQSIAFDSNNDFYILTRGSYISKWSKSGTQLMTARYVVDLSGLKINPNTSFDCDITTNYLYCLGGGQNTIQINTTTWTVTNYFQASGWVYGTANYSIDNSTRRLYFNAEQTYSHRLDLNPTQTITFNATLANVGLGNSFQIYDASGNAFGVQINVTGEVPCFLQGSKILRLDPETDEEYYVPVETLRRGDLIRTATCGYKAVAFIGRGTVQNPADDPDKKNRLYGFRDAKGRHPTLYLTGEHCLLYKKSEISEAKRREVREHMGDDYITETFHRVPACLDEKREAYRGHGPATIWHFALEHNNLYNNYAVWANGILVETCSIDFLTKKARLELV